MGAECETRSHFVVWIRFKKRSTVRSSSSEHLCRCAGVLGYCRVQKVLAMGWLSFLSTIGKMAGCIESLLRFSNAGLGEVRGVGGDFSTLRNRLVHGVGLSLQWRRGSQLLPWILCFVSHF